MNVDDSNFSGRGPSPLDRIEQTTPNLMIGQMSRRSRIGGLVLDKEPPYMHYILSILIVCPQRGV